MRLFEYTVQRHGWLIHAYAQLTTHFHLLVWTPEDNLSCGMQLLCGIYAQVFNREHARKGHLVTGRFMSVVVERPGHALEVCRYIALNPVRAGLCRSPEEWIWSSYRATVGLASSPSFLERDWLLGLFDRDPLVAVERLRAFVDAGAAGVRPLQPADP